MIYDRTQEDVDQAKQIRDQKVKKFIALTESEIILLDRGTITIETINRIENNQKELKKLFNSMGYWNTNIDNKQWLYEEIFDIIHFQRILNNTDILRDAFFAFSSTPKTPMPEYHFTNINNLEKIIYDYYIMINNIKSKYKRCGTFRCGEVR